MKKFLVLIVALSAFLTIDAFAIDTLQIGENPPCKVGYYDIDFTGPEVITYKDDCGCIYLIEYWYRTVASDRLDLNITNVIKIHDCGTCSKPLYKIYQEGMVRIWNVNDMNHPKTSNVYQTSKKSCQYIVADTPDGFGEFLPVIGIASDDIIELGELVPELMPTLPATNTMLYFDVYEYIDYCTDEICCKMYYNVDWGVDDKIDSLSWYDPGMGNQYSCLGGTNCTASCDWLEYNYGRSTGVDKKSVLTFTDSEIKIAPNPNSGVFTFSAVNLIADFYSVKITDVLGNQILEFDFKYESGIFEKEIELKNVRGTYFYKITNNSGLLQSGKFIIK